MRLLWISGRNLSTDLAGTTEKSLIRELIGSGCDLTFISPGTLSEEGVRHITVPTINFPGLVTLSGARSVRRILRRMDVSEFDLLLMDWRYVPSLSKIIRTNEVPWCIIDRGPPATSGAIGGKIRRELLRNIQKKFWESGWKIAEESASAGFVVSENHETIVRGFAENIRLIQIPAGSYSNQFIGEKSDPMDSLRLAYVGRIDRKRGIGAIIDLSISLKNRNLVHHISIAGEI